MSEFVADWLIPDWPAPVGIKACVTTRSGGVSVAPFDSFNLGDHVDDDPDAVAQNRSTLTTALNVQPAWLKQVHGVNVVEALPARVMQADASWTKTPGIACTIMTADCLPILLTNREGNQVVAVHEGWRGLAGGIVENALAEFDSEVMAWLGPAIGPREFEVGQDVLEAFTAFDPQAAEAFTPREQAGKWLADMAMLATQRLNKAGVSQVYQSGLCTVEDPQRFYSYRRDGITGRQATFIWIEE